MPQTIPCGKDELQTHINPTFQPFTIKEDDYSSSDSSLASLKRSLSSQAGAESSDTDIMPIVVTKATNFEE